MPATFTSRHFVARLAFLNQRLFIEALYSYRTEEEPFEVVQAILIRHLSEQEKVIQLIGSTSEMDMFSQAVESSVWQKKPAAAIGIALSDETPAPKPGIHFLALNLPHNLQVSLDHIESDVKHRIKQHHASAYDSIHFHSHADRHVTLVRFGHISHDEMPAYHHAIAAAIEHVTWGHDHKPFDLSSKVRGRRKLHVTDERWITIHVDRSQTLKHFTGEVIARVHKHDKDALAHTDFPDHAHISIAKADPGVSLKELRHILGGNTYEVKCDRFEVHHVHLKHAIGHLKYHDDHNFEVPGHP